MKRNKFSLSHYKLLTGNMGELIPLTWYECLPGDTIQHQTNMLLRVTPILAPLMHPVRIRIHNFFVPLRLIWDDFEDFITGGQDGNDSTEHPYITAGTVAEGDLADYLGIPPAAYAGAITYSALPFRAYNLIYNEHYRDQDLITEQTISTGNGADSTTDTDLLKVSWEKDFFTTSRPWEQRGSDVNIPLAGEAPVKADLAVASGWTGVLDSSDTARRLKAVEASSHYIELDSTAPSTGGDLYADLASATGVSVTDLRLYLALQRYKENMAEGGARYVEYLAHRWGVKSSDARLNLPEYISGGRQTIQFSEILSTNDDDSTDYAGRLRGHGISAMRTKKSRRFFEEHGIVMSLMSIVPKAIYATGLDRSWSRTDKEDYFTKELQLVGDRAILNKEVYSEHTTPDGTFSYQQRYDEYRGRPSGIAGEFRTALAHWHYARIFGSDPSLNQTFIECDPTKRQYASNSTDSFYIMCNHSIQARRQIAKFPKKRVL